MPISDLQRTVHDVVETLRNSRESGCSLLIGAGCSATADIPLASGIVQEFKQRYPRHYERAESKTYAHCMAHSRMTSEAV